jgi:hypothetical protein
MNAPEVRPGGRFVAVVTSHRGITLRVYFEPATEEEFAGYRFWLVYAGLSMPTGANLKLWPLDLIPPVRSALARGQDIDMRQHRKDRLKAKKEDTEQKKTGRLLSDDEDAEEIARALGLL